MLIDKSELLKAYDEAHNGPPGKARGLIEEAPGVEAVPLEPLCQWLAGYATPPNYALDEVREDSIDPESLVYTANDRVKAWEFHFRQLLRSGLMDWEGLDLCTQS